MMMKNSLRAAIQQVGPYDLIRIRAAEYDEIPKSGSYVHFNMGIATHVPGKIYALPRIIEPGRLDPSVPGGEIPPTLSFENILVARCESVDFMPIEDVGLEDFAHAMRGIVDAASLEQRILARYTVSRPHLSKEEIVGAGVTITRLLILGEIESLPR